MATFRLPIFGRLMPDASGDVWPSFLNAELTLGSLSPGNIDCIVMEYPTGSDIGGELQFEIPQNYAGSPVLVIKGVIDGSPANEMAFGCRQVSRSDDDTIDVAYETEDTAFTDLDTSGHADEDLLEETIAITPSSAYQPGGTVLLHFYRDDDVDTTTLNFLLTDLLFEYGDT